MPKLKSSQKRATAVNTKPKVADKKDKVDMDESDESDESVDSDMSDSEVEALVSEACEGMDLDTSSDSDEEESDSDSQEKETDSSKLFVIDKSSNIDNNVIIPSYDMLRDKKTLDGNKNNYNCSDSESDFELPESNVETNDIDDDIDSTSYNLASELQHDVNTNKLYVDLDAYREPMSSVKLKQRLLLPKNDELLKKSVVTPDFEKKHSVPQYQESVRQARKRKKKEKEGSKGKNWFHMPAGEMTEEKKNDLTVLQMRKILDPKRFYKAPDLKAPPKFFQMARIVEDPSDFYSSRIPKKQRKATMVDELLADAEFRKYNKRKYVEVQQSQPRHKGAFKHMKRLKKKKKNK